MGRKKNGKWKQVTNRKISIFTCSCGTSSFEIYKEDGGDCDLRWYAECVGCNEKFPLGDDDEDIISIS